MFFRSLAAIQSQVRREIEAEKKAAAQAGSSSSTDQSLSKPPAEIEASPLLAVQGVYFRCPLISMSLLLCFLILIQVILVL